MKPYRKEIDKFLIALDNFLEKYYEVDPKISNDFMMIFKANIGRAKKSLNEGNVLNFKILDRLFNKAKNDVGTIQNTYMTPLQKQGRLRKSGMLRRTAYGIEYKTVRDISYEHIFYKICVNEGYISFNNAGIFEGYLDKFGDSINEFIIPEFYHHTPALVIY